ncbi:MAG: endonuclease domain-containing protein [Alphaproteobacteria bacterium]|nr:endonuclease domain-containing protein [Alphaproteobacteria bacterium]
MPTLNTFLFKAYGYNPETGKLTLDYALEDGASFREEITFPDAHAAYQSLSAHSHEALDRAFQLIFLLAGVSYYKATIPRHLRNEAFALDEQTAAFCQKVYAGGLGEFAYRNKVDLDFVFETDKAIPQLSQATVLGLSARALVPVGGGKDSIVTIESLRKAGKPFTLFALGGAGELAEPIRRTIETAKAEVIHVRRVLSPCLIELNKQAGTLNGHVPITAILSSIAVACAILYGFNAVILSNERSANAPNLVLNGKEINHQYSKSFSFERDLATYVHDTIAADLHYFSLLRPLSETAIAKRFAAQASAYFSVFRSCNASFKQDEGRRARNWCCNCPKCRFVFLALASFMEKAPLIATFGNNLLDNPAQEEGFRELCGLAAFKPFECVGEIEESATLMAKLATDPAWKKDSVIAALTSNLTSKIPDPEAALDTLLKPSSDHLIPDEYAHALD